MYVRINTLAGILVGILVAVGSAPLSAQDPSTRPARDSATARADRRAADARAAAGIHIPEPSPDRARATTDTDRARLAVDCLADPAMPTGSRPAADVAARGTARADTGRAQAVRADTGRVVTVRVDTARAGAATSRGDTMDAAVSRTSVPCPPADSGPTGQRGTAETTRGAQPFNRDSAQTAARQRGEDIPGTAGGTAPNAPARDPIQRVDSDRTRTSRDSTRGNTTTRGTSTMRGVRDTSATRR